MTAPTRPPQPEAPLDAFLDGLPLRAAAFIVTLYGDVVVPRGGEAWIGDIIAACAGVGISQTLVRTAVSRLVAAGRIEGRRSGRRSIYRLAPGAEAEFAAAAQAIYGPPEPCGWRFVLLPEAGAEALMAGLERAGHARLRPQLAFGPDRGALPPGTLAFRAAPEGAAALLPGFAATVFDLDRHARAYAAFVARFAPLPRAAAGLSGAAALTARLILVHAYRAALLRDPRLPDEALPPHWPGHAARRLFTEAYLRLSPAADSQVPRAFSALDGPLPAETPVTRARLAQLARALDPAKLHALQPLAEETLHETCHRNSGFIH